MKHIAWECVLGLQVRSSTVSGHGVSGFTLLQGRSVLATWNPRSVSVRNLGLAIYQLCLKTFPYNFIFRAVWAEGKETTNNATLRLTPRSSTQHCAVTSFIPAFRLQRCCLLLKTQPSQLCSREGQPLEQCRQFNHVVEKSEAESGGSSLMECNPCVPVEE